MIKELVIDLDIDNEGLVDINELHTSYNAEVLAAQLGLNHKNILDSCLDWFELKQVWRCQIRYNGNVNHVKYVKLPSFEELVLVKDVEEDDPYLMNYDYKY